MSNLKEQFDKIVNIIEDEIGEYVSFEKLFDLGFMDKNSDFGTINEFFQCHGFKVNSLEDFEDIDEKMLNDAVAKSTCFSTWSEMYQLAGREYALRKLKNAGFDVIE